MITPTRAVSWHCGTWACINILNYFYGTNFWFKDTFDIETLIQFGAFDWDIRPSEFDLCRFLIRLWFYIEVYSTATKWDYQLFIEDPDMHSKIHNYTPYPAVSIKKGIECYKELLSSEKFKLHEWYTLDSIEKVPENLPGVKQMLLFWVDRFILYNEENSDWLHWWHILASLYDKESKQIHLLETYPEWKIINKSMEDIISSSPWDTFSIIIIYQQ